MTSRHRSDLDMPLALIATAGLLLLHDTTRPSLTTLLAGGPVPGSWWSHPDSGRMYAVGEELAHHVDVLACKLLDGKVTFVHRRLWPALAAVGRSKSPWQLGGLDDSALMLLARVAADGRLRIDGDEARAGKLLEARMLVLGERVHTDAGRHATELVSWVHWGRTVKLGRARWSGDDAQRELERVAALAAPGARLPWQGRRGAAR